MSVYDLTWALGIKGLSPIAKLILIYAGNGCDMDRMTTVRLNHLIDFCGADPVEIEDALKEIKEKVIGFDYRLEGSWQYTIGLPPHAPDVIVKTEQKAPNQSHCYIYVIAAHTRTKIGISRDSSFRKDQLQAWAPETLRVVWTACGTRNKIRQIEVAAHIELAPLNLGGEWFDVSPDHAVNVVKEIMKARGFNP
jgi:T5orf172 domain